MNPVQRDEGGIPRSRVAMGAPRGEAWAEEDRRGANTAKLEKLRGRSLRRRAGGRGLELRHSAYGYALIENGGKPVDDRSNMTLDEIEVWLDRATKQ
jgi:hypothetical protein